MFFSDCHTPDELKAQYRSLSKKLHPDKGGSKTDFQAMQNEYEHAKRRIGDNETKNELPNIFDVNGHYEYHRRKVKYAGVAYNHYYKFLPDYYGAIILIDIEHINLIFTKHNYVI